MAKPASMGRRTPIVVAALALTASAAPAAGAWSRTDLHAVTQPTLAGGHALVLAAAQGTLRLLALDLRTGRTLWSRPASTSANAPGQAPVIAVVHGTVVYLSPAGGERARMTGVDPRSGRRRWRTPAAEFTSSPGSCPDIGTIVCITGALAQNQWGTVLRFDARTGRQLQTLVFATDPYGREVGDGLYDTGERNPDVLVAARGAKIAWRRRLAAIFPRPGASTDWGWNFDRVGRVGLFVGSPGWKPTTITSARFVSDLSHSMAAGFRIADGKVAWRSPGTYVCGYLRCPGTPGSPRVGVRMLATGTVSGSTSDGKLPKVSADAKATLEGFDPATGRRRWRFPVGHGSDLILETLLPPLLGPTRVALRGTGGRLEALDLATGAHRPVASGTAAWCDRLTMYRQASGYPSNGHTIHRYIGQYARVPCTAAGTRAAIPAHVPAFVGVHSGGVVVWTDTRGVFSGR